MRRRGRKHGSRVLLLSLGASLLVHALLSFPLRAALPKMLARRPVSAANAKEPVRLVRLSRGDYERVLDRARARVVRAPQVARKPEPKPAEKPPEPKKPEEKREDTSLEGQIVEVPASADKRPPENARFLASESSRVERETIARRDLRDDTRKRVTNKLQDRESLGGPAEGVPVPGMKSEGGESKQEKKGEKGKAEAGKKSEFQLEVPKLARRDGLKLDLDGLSPRRVWNRDQSDEVPGTSDRLKLELGEKKEEAGGQSLGKESKQDGLPALKDLRPTLGTVARMSGSPSSDYVENVPEGEGTFLNTRSFKYATFFYQVRDSVAQFWKADVGKEMRRRDPTGDIYGPGDLKTILYIRLDDTGKVSEVRIEESSGFDFLDAVAVRAFHKAESFPNPPKGIVNADGHIDFHFTFVLYKSRSGPLDIFR